VSRLQELLLKLGARDPFWPENREVDECRSQNSPQQGLALIPTILVQSGIIIDKIVTFSNEARLHK
jgi:hypothetical protein